MGPELPIEEAFARLLLVLVLAGVVGIERELSEQEAGLRTHMLVGVGAALFVITGNYAWGEIQFGNDVGIVLDPSRVIAYVVTGVGFLGAGAILKEGANIRGLTTAASLWVVAAVGVTVGSGLYWLGLFVTALVILSLWPVRKLADLLGLRSRGSSFVVIELEARGRIAEVIAEVEDAGVEVVSTSAADEGDVRRLVLTVAGRRAEHRDLLDRLPRVPAVRRVWMSRTSPSRRAGIVAQDGLGDGVLPVEEDLPGDRK